MLVTIFVIFLNCKYWSVLTVLIIPLVCIIFFWQLVHVFLSANLRIFVRLQFASSLTMLTCFFFFSSFRLPFFFSQTLLTLYLINAMWVHIKYFFSIDVIFSLYCRARTSNFKHDCYWLKFYCICYDSFI